MKTLRYVTMAICSVLVLIALKNLVRDAIFLARGAGEATSYVIGRMVGSFVIGILLVLLIDMLWRKNKGAPGSNPSRSRLDS